MELPEKFNYPFSYTPHPLVREAAERLITHISSDPSLDSLFAEGKMMGVLVVVPPLPCRGRHVRLTHTCQTEEQVGVLWGFSGVVKGTAIVDGFVPPIYDITDPDGYFRKRESEISALTAKLAETESQSERDAVVAERKAMSEELQRWIFEQFVVLNAAGESRSVLDVFAERGLVPPGGTGDCALPKMLQYAYANGMKPLAFGEFWYGQSPRYEVRHHGCFYPSCTGKCGPLLAYMLKGLDVEPNPMEALSGAGLHEPEILFEDDTLIVVDKPSGLLSVPGRIKADSLLVWLQRRENAKKHEQKVTVYSCHRLDMDTSGVMVFAKTADAQSAIQQQFENREVSKTYLALLKSDGLESDKGTISLPLNLDYYDRPRQMVDYENGKHAVTDYEIVDRHGDDGIVVRFTPHTGRTHQLRVHSAHPDGLNSPIKGDRLYGGTQNDNRLCLHAESLSFTHPVTGARLEFRTEPDFL